MAYIDTLRPMQVVESALRFGAVPQDPPSTDKSVCRRLWNDGFVVMSRPFVLAVMPLITLSVSVLFVLFLLIVLRYATCFFR